LRNHVPREIEFLKLPCSVIGELEPVHPRLNVGRKTTHSTVRASPAKGLPEDQCPLYPESGHRNRPRYQLRRTNSGSLAIFAAIRRASSFVRGLGRCESTAWPFEILPLWA